MIKEAPIIFHPYLKSVIWGGEKICKYKDIPQSEPNIGESWEISEVPGHESVVAEGFYKGMNLTELIERFGEELLGNRVYNRYNGKFPLLIKIIDASDNLSVQVHPDDELAMKRHNSLGKTEMWYIIDTEKGAKIYAGLKVKMTPEEYVERVANGEFAETLAVHDSHAGDVFFLPAGRVHAIGAGNLLAEIQESSDITYRIYDYDRKDASGKSRELHTELAKDAIDYRVQADYRTSVPSDEREAVDLVDCDHFKTKKLKINGEKELHLDGSSFMVLICIKGNLHIQCKDSDAWLKAGHSVLIPASVSKISLSGNAVVLSGQCS